MCTARACRGKQYGIVLRSRRRDATRDIVERIAAKDQRPRGEIERKRQAEQRNARPRRCVCGSIVQPLHRRWCIRGGQQLIEIDLLCLQPEMRTRRRAEVEVRVTVEAGGKITAELNVEIG